MEEEHKHDSKKWYNMQESKPTLQAHLTWIHLKIDNESQKEDPRWFAHWGLRQHSLRAPKQQGYVEGLYLDLKGLRRPHSVDVCIFLKPPNTCSGATFFLSGFDRPPPSSWGQTKGMEYNNRHCWNMLKHGFANEIDVTFFLTKARGHHGKLYPLWVGTLYPLFPLTNSRSKKVTNKRHETILHKTWNKTNNCSKYYKLLQANKEIRQTLKTNTTIESTEPQWYFPDQALPYPSFKKKQRKRPRLGGVRGSAERFQNAAPTSHDDLPSQRPWHPATSEPLAVLSS